MEHQNAAQFLGLLALMFAAAKLFGNLAQRIGQPKVLGELLSGVILGKTALGLVDPQTDVLHVLSELGVVILLFSIGLETDLKALLNVGPASMAVAIVGVVLPFFLGYLTCLLLNLDHLVAIVAGAGLTATSVGITARVLSDLGQLQTQESRVILGAAVIDDVIGLVILTVVAEMAEGQRISLINLTKVVAIAFGFLIVVLLVGSWIVARVSRPTFRFKIPGPPTIPAAILAFGLAWLADRLGSAVIMGAFAAGVLLAKHRAHRQIEEGVTNLGQFFVPLFFIAVGAAVDVRVLNPMHSENWKTLGIAGALSVVAVIGKFVAGYAAFWLPGDKRVIGAGMIPRGEVGLIFAQMGLAGGIFKPEIFAAVTLVVMITTFLAPPLLKALVKHPARIMMPSGEFEGIEDLVTEA